MLKVVKLGIKAKEDNFLKTGIVVTRVSSTVYNPFIHFVSYWLANNRWGERLQVDLSLKKTLIYIESSLPLLNNLEGFFFGQLVKIFSPLSLKKINL